MDSKICWVGHWLNSISVVDMVSVRRKHVHHENNGLLCIGSVDNFNSTFLLTLYANVFILYKCYVASGHCTHVTCLIRRK